MAKDLAIIGPFPPPIGGIATHLERLLPHLENAGIDYFVYNASGPANVPDRVASVAKHSRAWFFRYLLTSREPVAYIMTNQWPVWAGSWFLSRIRGKKVVLAFHSEEIIWALERPSGIRRALIRASLRAAAALIAVNTHIADALKAIPGTAEKTHVLPAFIPPTDDPGDAKSIPEHAYEFAETHDPTLLVIGAPVIKQDTDLYGIDMTIDLVDSLRRDYPNLGVIWALLDFIGSRPEYAEKMRAEIKRRNLEAHWLFIPPQKIFHPLYKHADIFLRPTLSDGDAISIREALHFGVPVIASDAIPRPEGVRTFTTRDRADFEASVREALGNLEGMRGELASMSVDCTVEQETALLRDLIGESRK